MCAFESCLQTVLYEARLWVVVRCACNRDSLLHQAACCLLKSKGAEYSWHMQTQLVRSMMAWLLKMQPAARAKEHCLSVAYLLYCSVVQVNNNAHTKENKKTPAANAHGTQVHDISCSHM